MTPIKRKRNGQTMLVATLGYNHIEPGAPGNLQTYRICGARTRNEATVNELCQLAAGWGTSHPGVGRCKLHGGAKMVNPNRYSPLMRGRLQEIARATIEQDTADPLDLLSELEVQRVLLGVMLDRFQTALDLSSQGPANPTHENPTPDNLAARLPPPVVIDVTHTPAPAPIPGGIDNSNYHNHPESADQDAAPRSAADLPLSDQPTRREPGREGSAPDLTAAQAAILASLNATAPLSNKKKRQLTSSSMVHTVDGGSGGQIASLSPQCTTHSPNFSQPKSEDIAITMGSILEQIRLQLSDIVNTVTKITTQRNQTAITKAEITWLLLTWKEGMNKFVPRENREAYLKWIMENIPGAMKMGEEEAEDEADGE